MGHVLIYTCWFTREKKCSSVQELGDGYINSGADGDGDVDGGDDGEDGVGDGDDDDREDGHTWPFPAII